MILRDYLKLIFSIWLSVSTLINSTEGERWSRQVSNSEWIPLAHPRSQIPQSSVSNNQPPPLPSIQALNLPPALRQEYQQQLHQLQRTQESIHKLLLLQQQLRSQQQLLQNQQYLPNVVGPDEEKQQFRQNSISNAQHSELNSDALSSPQLSAEILPSVYSSQEFKSSHHSQEIGEVPSASGESEEKPENGSNEEIQVVYVPAETLAQRGQPKEERNRDHKQFSLPRQQNQRYPLRHQQQQQQQQQQHHHQHQNQQHHQHPQRQPIENVEGSVNYSEDRPTFNSEIIQFPRGQAETDQFFKQARQKELDRLNEERKEIQKQAKMQAAMRLREQERMRQRETEKKMKELEKIEELAKQRELDRIREERERHRLDELKREKERVAKLKEELGRREIERLAAVERQKQFEIERSRAQQKESEKLARQEEEARTKELALKKELAETPTAEQLINQQHHQQHHTETGKHQKRTRNKQRQRPINHNHHHHHHHKHTSDQTNKNHETEATTPTPNQPPLAVFMGSEAQVEEVKIVDVLRVLRDVKTIAVLDQAVPESPKVFVGPSNLDPPHGYAKFDLPYLSALDTNRVERRVDKLPFFVAPLNFNPPHGYSKIPFPAPHIGSVIINNLEGNSEPSGPALETVNKPTPNPLIEPNSFIATSGQSSTYQASYESPTVTPYSTYSQEYVTPQYQSSAYPPTSIDKFRYRHQQEQQQHYEQPTGLQNFKRPQSESISSYDEQVTASPRPHHNSEYTEQSYLGAVTQDDYRRPNVVSSYSYNQEQVSTTPAYQDSYAHTRVQPNKEQDIVSQLAQLNQHDFSQHRHVDSNYQHPSQHANTNSYHQQYHLSSSSPNSYEETSIRNPVGPPQYSLPAELPPIHPQLPGLVNSLSEHKESDKTIPTTTTTAEPITTTVTTTTTETPTTTYRVRIRQRGRITRPTTTSTTTSSPSTHRSHAERTRRPFNRSRSRHTTTTEEYRETSYEAAKDKVPDTTLRYSNTPEPYHRPNTQKIHKFKTRTSSGDRTTYEPITALNQIPNIQTHETLSDEASPTDDSGDSHHSTYMQYGSPISTESTPNAYLQQENVENPLNSYSTEIDYSKSPNYPRVHGPPRNDGLPLNNAPISHQQQQYYDRFSAQNGGYHANLDKQPHNGYEYDIRDGISPTSAASPTPNDYSYYQGKNDGDNGEQIPTEPPIYTHILEYAATPQPKLQQDQLSNGDYASSGSFDERNRGSNGDEQLYNKYSSKEYFDHQLEITTEPIQTTTTTTTTESAPVVYRQRVRARLGGRPRQDSVLQTQSRGPQDEYVRFSAVNPTSSGGRQSSSSSSNSRTRDSPRSRSKTRTNHQSQVQSEGNEYVRIQSANRPTMYPKTIVQTALRTPTTTTTTTTTSSPPTTTTEQSVFDDDSNEYGFIRSPNFNQPHHQLSSKFRAPESPILLQNVGPTDGTAEDSSPTHTQVPKHRQKYQSPNRPRLVIKSTTPAPTTQSSYDNGPYTTKSRVRTDEPKNKIRTKGRRPVRRRTTTTSTTTEYTLEGSNNLPLEENYPRIQINSDESHAERQQPLYEQNYEIPQDSNSQVSSSRADYVEENYPRTEFAINFGGSAADSDEQHDQSHLSHKYQSASDYRSGSPSGLRLRPYSNHAMTPERDIYGSESQWSTKLTKSSFQPVNQLDQNEEKVNSNEHTSQEMKEDIPEIITAQPEDAFITVLVTSDDMKNKTRSELPSSSLSSSSVSESETKSADFGQKMSHSNITESSTQQIDINSTSEVSQPRRAGQRRRRVRVRVRPAPPDDFVTAESQYYNSAVNSLVQDRVKYNTHVDSLSGIHSKTLSENLAEKQERPSPLESTELSNSGESIPSTDTTTINYTEVPEHARQSEAITLQSIDTDDNMKINNSHENISMTTEISMMDFETTVNDLTTIIPLMTTMTIPRKSWDSTKAYSDWIMRKMVKPFTSGDNQLNDKLDNNEDSNAHRSDLTNKLLDNESENHPKNHRSEWSEVHYPSDRGNFGYGRSENLSPTTQLPGFISKSVGDTNVKTLSDYVQAIFDTMKNADEERAIVDNAPNLWNDDQSKSTTSTGIHDIPSAPVTVMSLEKTSTSSSFPENTDKITETTTEKDEDDIINSTTNIIETSTVNLSTQTNTETTTELATTVSSIATTFEPSIITTELAVDSDKNSTSKLSPVIRTSTTTKVSHMTEICYRGRCIMTKPKKDFHKR